MVPGYDRAMQPNEFANMLIDQEVAGRIVASHVGTRLVGYCSTSANITLSAQPRVARFTITDPYAHLEGMERIAMEWELEFNG